MYHILIFIYKYISQRLALLKLLQNGGKFVGDLVLELKITQPKVSLILKELRDLKLVTVNTVGKKRYYELNRLVFNQYTNDIKKIISDFESNGSNEIIVRRII